MLSNVIHTLFMHKIPFIFNNNLYMLVDNVMCIAIGYMPDGNATWRTLSQKEYNELIINMTNHSTLNDGILFNSLLPIKEKATTICNMSHIKNFIKSKL